MKSYFARLTARVAPPRETARPYMGAAGLQDPFEENSSPETFSPPSASPADRVTSETPSIHPAAPVASFTTDSIRAASQSPDAPIVSVKNPAEIPVLTPKRVKTGETGKVESLEAETSTKQTEQTTRLTPEKSNLKATRNVSSVNTNEERISAFESPKKPTTGLLEDADGSQVVNSANDSESSEAILLRKADAFMRGLFERRASDERTAKSDTEPSQSAAEPLRPAAQVPHRLVPAPAVRTVSKPEPEQPSLVIGKLTVEVVPQKPATPAKPERIIVKQTSGRVSGGIPSSRRFGLSQF